MTVRLSVKGEYVSLAPKVAPTQTPPLGNPKATPVPIGNISGIVLFQESAGGGIHVVNGDGTGLTKITYGLDPAWSPDGKQIAFIRWGNPGGGIYVAKADGSQERLVYGADQLRGAQWSADGTRIAFYRQKGGTLEDTKMCFFADMCFTIAADPYWKLAVVDVASGKITEPKCSTHCLMPTWSNDNHTIAYTDGALGMMGTSDVGGANEYQINIKTPLVESARFSPDGSQIVYQVWNHDHWDISSMTANGKATTALTTIDLMSFKKWNNVSPDWSADGKQILFLSDRNGKWEFFAVDADGKNLKQVLKTVTDSMAIKYNFVHERAIDWAVAKHPSRSHQAGGTLPSCFASDSTEPASVRPRRARPSDCGVAFGIARLSKRYSHGG